MKLKHSPKQTLNDPAATTEGNRQTFEKFMGLVRNEPSRAFYSYKDVASANKLAAIDTLLISDALIHSDDVKERRKYNRIVKDVKLRNGKVAIFSSLNSSSEQLNMLTGIAAILRFPLILPEDEGNYFDEEKSTGLPLQLRTDATHDKLECKRPRKFCSKQGKMDDSEAFDNSHYSRAASGYIDQFEQTVENVAASLAEEEEEEEKTDYEVPVARSYMTLGDCIVTKR
uniref:ERF1_3 domain-containing protein n=1 Tax=Panagrellus redivivus TaxID=6233 RepID=A0A7E4VDR6_PANRE